MRITRTTILILLLLCCGTLSLQAQWDKTESVLKDHTWYKIGVVEDGVYALDRETLQAFGVNVSGLDPARIRLYGNVPGMLPESNATQRYDDLNEIAIQVTGAEDGSFDEGDRILFYGHGPVNTTWLSTGSFDYERNSFSDTVYYFLCADSDQAGLRMTENPLVTVPEGSAVITRFPDCLYHESEEISPFASGRRWYGDMITPQEGYKEFIFEMPDLIQSEVIRVKSRVLGRCPSRFTYNMRVNNNLLADHQTIEGYANMKFGTEHELDKMCFVDTDRLEFRYSINASTETPLLYIDYFLANFWRTLRFRDASLAFTIVPSQMTSPQAEILIQGAGPSVTCWDVTDPLLPAVQPLTYQALAGRFGAEGAAVKRYLLFEPSGIKTPASGYPIPNQNLHAINAADMLIITPRLFWDQATEVAEFHQERDGINSVIVDINEIYNEFGTGMTDPTAMRDFIRMVYLRCKPQLRYVLLMGKGTHDYRDIKGFGNNFVPTYENTANPWYEVASMCSDDYFALMDNLEGENCTGRVDLGVGRFPITTPEQGNDVIAKIKHYVDLEACRGLWKNTHLFLADNDVKGSYLNYCEALERIIDTAWFATNSKKIYADSYPVVNTPSGERIPKANEVLMRTLHEGVGVMSYTGHGGVKGLMDEQVINNSDILAMDNFDHLPFVHTATCEFSKFDNPNLVSAGELMFLNAHGGAIAMLTTVRPTLATNNQMLSKAFHKYVYASEDGLPMRFGDICRLSKADPMYYTEKNIGYFLFGDPALRLNFPKRNILASKINGSNTNVTLTITAASTMSVEGYVTQMGMRIDTAFNGVIDVRLYDKESKFSTLELNSGPIDYYFHNDVLFEGKATVTAGRFDIQMPVPSDVNFSQGMARLCFYAYDSIRVVDAFGVCDLLRVVEADPSTALDNQGPEIHLYWNTPEFESGDVVGRHGTLYADLSDEQGIYHYNVSIGRDILMNSTLSEYDNLNLNDRFEPVVDDYRKGRIRLNINNLNNGRYAFKLRAWDTQNNASESEIVFVVEDGILLAEVHNYPNPMNEETYFSFVHGDKSEALSVRIEVFDMLGRRVRDLREETSSTAGVVPPIRWDGRNGNGQKLKAGVYVYRLSVTPPEGKTLTVSNRLVIG